MRTRHDDAGTNLLLFSELLVDRHFQVWECGSQGEYERFQLIDSTHAFTGRIVSILRMYNFPQYEKIALVNHFLDKDAYDIFAFVIH